MKRTAMMDKGFKSQSAVMNKKHKFNPSYLQVFPMYGLWDGKQTFKSHQTVTQPTDNDFKEANNDVDKTHFKKRYMMKTYMEEMLKAKNMMMQKK